MSWESYAPYHYWSSHCFVWKLASLEQFTDTITQMLPGESGTYHSGEVLCISLQTAGCTAALVWIANMLLSLATDASATFQLSPSFLFFSSTQASSFAPASVRFISAVFCSVLVCVPLFPAPSFPVWLLFHISLSLSFSLCPSLASCSNVSVIRRAERLLQLHFSFSEVIELWFESAKACKNIHPL